MERKIGERITNNGVLTDIYEYYEGRVNRENFPDALGVTIVRGWGGELETEVRRQGVKPAVVVNVIEKDD